MAPGTRVKVARGAFYVGLKGTVLTPYRGPFGPSVVVRFDDGREMALRIADLDTI